MGTETYPPGTVAMIRRSEGDAEALAEVERRLGERIVRAMREEGQDDGE